LRASAMYITTAAFAAVVLMGSAAHAQQGFGATTPGGAGRPVVHVTNLNDSGPGSLRAAVSAGNRTVVFDVAGDIGLLDHVYVTGAFITIDGLTAPPPGITLRGRGLILRGSRGVHDVIVRGLRIRDSSVDGVQVAYGAYNIRLEQMSVSGSVDGNLDITESAHDVTVAWSILAAPAPPQKNSLIKYRPSRITLHHNAFAGASQRNPLISIDDVGSPAVDTTVDMRNNLVRGWAGGHGTMVRNRAVVNMVANYFDVAGSDGGDSIIVDTATAPRVYMAGNRASDGRALDRLGTEPAPFAAAAVTTQDPCEAAQLVVALAGVRPLDLIDTRHLSGLTLPCAAPGPDPDPDPDPDPGDDPDPVPTGPGTYRVTIRGDADDAREYVTGPVRLADRYLVAGKGNTLGFRFGDVPVPRRAVVESAVLRLFAAGSVKRSVALRYAAEATGSSAPFSAVAWDLTRRPRTVATVDHVPGPWTLNAYNATPDLTRLVQEVVNRADWAPGNSLGLFVLDRGSLSTRLVTGFGAAPAAAPTLEIRFRIP
jgi:pectate lyase